MTDVPPKRPPLQMPQLPLRPSRPAFSRRTRVALSVALVTVVAVLVVGGALLVHSSAKPHVVTIPKADRNATPALLRAAAAVNFRPPSLAGVGQMEGKAASEAKIETKGLLPLGAAAPDFTLHTPTGKPVSLRSLRGRAVLLEILRHVVPALQRGSAASARSLRAPGPGQGRIRVGRRRE